MTIGRLFRSSCDECSSTNLWWGTPDELAARLTFQGREVRRRAEMIEATEAWLCLSCRNWGLLASGGWDASSG